MAHKKMRPTLADPDAKVPNVNEPPRTRTRSARSTRLPTPDPVVAPRPDQFNLVETGFITRERNRQLREARELCPTATSPTATTAANPGTIIACSTNQNEDGDGAATRAIDSSQVLVSNATALGSPLLQSTSHMSDGSEDGEKEQKASKKAMTATATVARPMSHKREHGTTVDDTADDSDDDSLVRETQFKRAKRQTESRPRTGRRKDRRVATVDDENTAVVAKAAE